VSGENRSGEVTVRRWLPDEEPVRSLVKVAGDRHRKACKFRELREAMGDEAARSPSRDFPRRLHRVLVCGRRDSCLAVNSPRTCCVVIAGSRSGGGSDLALEGAEGIESIEQSIVILAFAAAFTEGSSWAAVGGDGV